MPDAAFIRLGAFAGFLVLFLALEHLWPRRALADRSVRRRIRNVGMAAGNSVVARLAVPVGLVGISAWGDSNGWGLLPKLDLPDPALFLVGFFTLDLVVYAQHVAFHKIPVLWRLHRMHHADVNIDTTTGVRFHPVEIVLSLVWKGAIVVALGIPAAPLVLFEIALNATALFNHANWKLPLGIDRWLRWVIVTPDMHRVHHSVIRQEHDSNFGFNFPWWDHWFRTYQAQPANGHEGMRIGLNGYTRSLSLWEMLADAFRARTTDEKARHGNAEPKPPADRVP